MAVFRTSWALCLNDQVVPAQTKVCPIVDPYGLMEGLDLDMEETEVSLVRFHATADMSWLMKSLDMPVKWWIYNCYRLPMIFEIREGIKAKKNKKEPANHKCLVALQIRGKTLFVVNDTHGTTLGLPESQPLPGEQPGSLASQERTLHWFCDQLYKDIQNLPKEKPLKEDRDPPVPAEHQEAFQMTLESIQAHSQCSSCHYMPSRLGFKVIRGDKTCREFRLVGLHKKRKPEGAQGAFERVLSMALEFLEHKEDPEEDQFLEHKEDPENDQFLEHKEDPEEES